MQVGAVIPLAVALRAQADGDGVKRPVQAGVVARRLFLFGRQGHRRRRQHQLLAQFVERQLLIEATGASDRLQRLQGLAALGLVSGQRQLGPRPPVDPDAVLAGLFAHGTQGAQGLAPLAGAQRGAHLPAQQVVVEVGVAVDLAEVARRHRVELERGLLADHAQHPVLLLGQQLHGPARFQQVGGRIRVAEGDLDQGQHHQLLPYPARGRGALGQKLHRAVVDQGQIRQDLGCHHAHGVAGGARPVGLGGQARLAPDVECGQPLAGIETVGGQGAAVFGLTQAMPQAPHLFSRTGGRHALEVIHRQRIAAQLAVVTHAVQRVLRRKTLPVAPLAQQLQPVGPHAVFLVSADITRHEGLDLIGAGLVQPGPQLPVGGPGLQRVAAGQGQQLGQLLAVPFAKGLAHVDQHVIGPVLACPGRPGLRPGKPRRSTQNQGHQKRCQNLL